MENTCDYFKTISCIGTFILRVIKPDIKSVGIKGWFVTRIAWRFLNFAKNKQVSLLFECNGWEIQDGFGPHQKKRRQIS